MNIFFGNAKWIGTGNDADMPVILHKFTAKKGEPARITALGFGVFIIYINGVRAHREEYLPLNTDFDERDYPVGEITAHRAYPESFDISGLLKDGENILAVALGNVQYTAPYTLSGGGPGGWGSAIVTVPHEFYRPTTKRDSISAEMLSLFALVSFAYPKGKLGFSVLSCEGLVALTSLDNGTNGLHCVIEVEELLHIGLALAYLCAEALKFLNSLGLAPLCLDDHKLCQLLGVGIELAEQLHRHNAHTLGGGRDGGEYLLAPSAKLAYRAKLIRPSGIVKLGHRKITGLLALHISEAKGIANRGEEPSILSHSSP